MLRRPPEAARVGGNMDPHCFLTREHVAVPGPFPGPTWVGEKLTTAVKPACLGSSQGTYKIISIPDCHRHPIKCGTHDPGSTFPLKGGVIISARLSRDTESLQPPSSRKELSQSAPAATAVYMKPSLKSERLAMAPGAIP